MRADVGFHFNDSPRAGDTRDLSHQMLPQQVSGNGQCSSGIERDGENPMALRSHFRDQRVERFVGLLSQSQSAHPYDWASAPRLRTEPPSAKKQGDITLLSVRDARCGPDGPAALPSFGLRISWHAPWLRGQTRGLAPGRRLQTRSKRRRPRPPWQCRAGSAPSPRLS